MDNSMLLMFEKDIRRGINQVVYCYAKANKKYIGDQYNADKESSYLQYHDANNLYGWAMAQDLPTYGFKWAIDVKTFNPRQIAKTVKKNRKGYLLEVDVDGYR